MEIPPESFPIFARQTRSSFREPSARLIIVIGAGIAGLAAARRLQLLQYQILDGGRILTSCNAVDFSCNYIGDLKHNSALCELCESIKFDLSNSVFQLDSDDALAYPISGSSLSLYYIRSGFGPILTQLASGLDIKYNEVVIDVDAIDQLPFITVRTESGESFVSDGVICTVPISLLKEGTITFSPSPFDDALGDITMETLNNVIMEFPKLFWPKTPDTFTFGSKLVFQSLVRAVDLPILIVTTSDPYHEQASVQELVNILMNIIRGHYPDAPYPIAAVRTAWDGDRFAKGSFPKRLGESGTWWRSEATKALPLEFAGDACTDQPIGNIETALKSAVASAMQLHDFFGRLSSDWSLRLARNKNGGASSIPSVMPSLESPVLNKSEQETDEIQSEPESARPRIQAEGSPMHVETDSFLQEADSAWPQLAAFEKNWERSELSAKPALAKVSKADLKREQKARRRDFADKPSKKAKVESLKKGPKVISKYISRLVKEIGPDLSLNHADYIRNRVSERMIEEWKAKGQISDFLTSERKQRIRHFVQKYVVARTKPPPSHSDQSP